MSGVYALNHKKMNANEREQSGRSSTDFAATAMLGRIYEISCCND